MGAPNPTQAQNMETSEVKKVGRQIQHGFGARKTIRGNHKDQRVDTKQIIGGPQITDFLGGIASEEIDEAISYRPNHPAEGTEDRDMAQR